MTIETGNGLVSQLQVVFCFLFLQPKDKGRGCSLKCPLSFASKGERGGGGGGGGWRGARLSEISYTYDLPIYDITSGGRVTDLFWRSG